MPATVSTPSFPVEMTIDESLCFEVQMKSDGTNIHEVRNVLTVYRGMMELAQANHCEGRNCGKSQAQLLATAAEAETRLRVILAQARQSHGPFVRA